MEAQRVRPWLWRPCPCTLCGLYPLGAGLAVPGVLLVLRSLMDWVGFPDSSVGKESTCNAGDPSSVPGLGRSAGEGIGYPLQYSWAFLMPQLIDKEPAYNAGYLGLIPGLGRCLGEGNGYPLWYSGLENSEDCIDHGVAKSRTRPSTFHFNFSLSSS